MIPLREYLEVVMTCRPMKIISDKQRLLIVGDSDWQVDGPYIIENDPETIGMDNTLCAPLVNNEWRIWQRRDWELCDNKRREAVARLNNLQADREQRYKVMVDAVKRDLISKGATSAVVDMLFQNIQYSQVEMMYKNIVPTHNSTTPIH